MLDARLARQRFFDKQVHLQAWKDSMAGENEKRALEMLGTLGYIEGKDYVRQHPIGERFVIDFAFINEQVALEIDGRGHLVGLQMKKDRKRDKYLKNINWVPLRIQDSWLFGYKGSFYKCLIKEIVEERRAQWSIGTLYPIDFRNYEENDYD